MPLSTSIIQFVLSAITIVIAGTFLTKNADKIAHYTGWGRLFVGGLLLAAATSLPELMVDINAVKMNHPNLAAGDLLGSSLFNLFILAILDFVYPSEFRRTSFSPRFLHHSLAAVLTIVLSAIIGIGISSRLDISFLNVSIFAWFALITYLYGLRLIFIEGKTTTEHEVQNLNNFEGRKLFFAVLGYLSCSAIILIAAPFLVKAADSIATISNLGHTFIGTTLLALTTSLPELVATLAAFRIGAPDLALGNIFGSNAFNMILFVPLDFLFEGPLFSYINNVHAVTAFSIVTTTGIAVIGQLYRKKERTRLTEPSSELVVIVTMIFLFLLYYLK